MPSSGSSGSSTGSGATTTGAASCCSAPRCSASSPGLYYFFWHRRFHGHKYFYWGEVPAPGDRPADREDAELADGAGTVDSFPGSSIWPFVMGMGAFMSVLALVFGVWLLFIGVPLILTALTGVTAESRRGGTV